MRDLVRSEAEESERLRTLTPAVVEEMWASGLMSSFNPAAAGGVEIGFWDYFKVGAPLTLLTLLIGTLWLWL